MYLLIYLINKSKLPWSDFDKKFKGKKMNFSDYLLERLKKSYTMELF